MNIHRYLLPASIAAAVHVALFSVMPDGTYVRLGAAPSPTVVSPPRPAALEDPPDEPEPVDEVRPLRGEPAPVSIAEPPAAIRHAWFELPVESTRPSLDLTHGPIPKTIGEPDGDPAGHAQPGLPIWTVAALDRAPRAQVQVPPDYPFAMKQRWATGSVVVEFDVDRTGRVSRAEAIQFTDREFVEAALRAVRQWRFEPGRKDGRTVPFRMAVPIVFSMESGN
jgi:protein TonB